MAACKDQRKCSQPDVVGDGDPGLIGQHGDEMRRPDAAPGGGAGEREPGASRPAAGGDGAMKEADGNEAGQKADEAGKHDQAPIVLTAETAQNAEHDLTASLVDFEDS